MKVNASRKNDHAQPLTIYEVAELATACNEAGLPTPALLSIAKIAAENAADIHGNTGYVIAIDHRENQPTHAYVHQPSDDGWTFNAWSKNTGQTAASTGKHDSWSAAAAAAIAAMQDNGSR